MDADQRITLPTSRMIARIDGAIGWMIFNNPERRNAMSADMWEAVPEIMDHFERDPAVRVIVLRGAGEKAFVSGADISQFEQLRSTPENVAKYDKLGDRANARLTGTGKPTIAMIQGYCIGGGVGIAVSCDLRIATEGSKFGVPAARLGLGYAAPGVKRLMNLVGPAHVKEIFFTARHFTAAEALAMGLANRVVPEAELETFVRSYCAMIADNAPLTMRALKATADALVQSPPGLDLAESERLTRACFGSEDYVEGRRAFMEKRRPVFSGR